MFHLRESFIEHTRNYLQYLQFQKRYSEHTVKAYTKDLELARVFFISIKRIPQINEISHHDVRSWIYYLHDQGLGVNSINRKLSSLKSFFRYMVKMKHLDENVAALVSNLKTEKKLPTYQKEEDLLMLISDLSEETFIEIRDKLMIRMFYECGLRRSELIKLKINDVNLDENTIKVLGKGNKERKIPISATLSKLIILYLGVMEEVCVGEGVEVLFITDKGREVYPKFVYNKIKKMLSLISSSSVRSPHTLRHSFATHLLNQGADISAIKELLGHSSLAATQVYTHNSISKLKKIYAQAHPKGKQ